MALSLAHPEVEKSFASFEGTWRCRKYSGFALTAFVFHLLVPALSAVDIGINWVRPGTTTDVRIVFAVDCLWFLFGIILLLRGSWRRMVVCKMGKALISFWLFAVLAVAFETSYWAFAPPIRPFLFEVNTTSTIKTDPITMPGIGGDATVSTNEIGLRGRPVPSPHDALRIVTIGGSTTACSLLDDSAEWPSVLMQKLNERGTPLPVWIGNAGVDGQGTVHHLALLQTLPIFRHAALLLFMIGANDMQAALSSRGQSSQAMLERDAALRSEEILGGGHPRKPFLRRSRLYEILRSSIITVTERAFSTSEYDVVEWLRNNRDKRAHAPTVALPDLSVALSEYRRRVVALAQACQSLASRCAFVTQPSIYRNNLTTSENALLWGAWVGPAEHPDGYLSPSAAARAIAAFNETLLDVCAKKSLTCFDLAGAIPHTSAMFYDDVHLNEQGAREAAGFLAERLTELGMFASSQTNPRPVLLQ